jgi:hypothetical protein
MTLLVAVFARPEGLVGHGSSSPGCTAIPLAGPSPGSNAAASACRF